MPWRHKTAKVTPLSEASASAAGTHDLEDRTQAIGRELLSAARAAPKSGLWSDALVASTLKDERFKTELFRFVDVFPVLKTPEQVHRHLMEYVQQPGVVPPTMISMALKAGGLLKGTLAKTVGSQIQGMARTFIAGETVEDALPAIEKRWKEGIGFSVDLLGEAVVSHPEAAEYRQKYLRLIKGLPGMVAGWAANPLLDSDHLGAIPRVNISLKISALDGHVSPVDAEGSLDRLMGNLAPLLQAAAKGNVFINFDMEQHALKELTIRVFKRCCERFDFHAGLAVQAYLRSAEEDTRDLAEWARAAGRVVTVRLIKGAYWDYETLHAEMMNWPSPVWAKKQETDACFERVAAYLIGQTPRKPGEGGVKVALGTHNMRSIARAMAVVERAGLPQNAVEFQALRGMADDVKPLMVQRGWRVRAYMPLGEMIPGMAYLVRRLLENTSNQSWLRAGHASGVSDEALLAAPHAATNEMESPPADAEDARAKQSFRNEPLRDFSQAAQREAFAAALAQAKVKAVANSATGADADAAISRAQAAFPAWRDAGQEARSAIIKKAAEILRSKRDALAAEIVIESHKTWGEADGDACEAIDFCEFYAREARALFAPRALSHIAGELNEGTHHPRGVAAVIAPWNFPLSIPTGMTAAALVTGNTVILKPAEQTPAVALRLCEALWQAGVPADALQFLAGAGEIVGASLVKDSRVANIAFTGSAAVGMEILRAAHTRDTGAALKSADGYFLIPRVIAEMGGKNAMIIDDSADLDEAVLAVRQSAFGYAGQKCSAASRAIVLDSIHDAFVKRLVESTQALMPGDPRDPGTDIGPVIDADAAEKISRYIAIGKEEATLVCPGPETASPSSIGDQIAASENIIRPHIFINVLAHHRIAREEIFGPVLAVLRAKDFDHALQLANDSAYKLTGGLFSRTPSHLARARSEFHVGNLYINRTITGALVSRQPFGGMALSGTGPKAGGRQYLLPFMDEQAVTENALRRGFAPQ